MPIALFQSVGVWEILLLLLVLLVVFGPKRLPEMGRSLGRGMREFKDSVSGDAEFDDEDIEDAELMDEAELTGEVEVATTRATAEPDQAQPATTQTEAQVAAEPAPEAPAEAVIEPESEQTSAEAEGETERVSS